MTTPVPRSQTAPDAMPTTRGLDFYATDPNLEFAGAVGHPVGDLGRGFHQMMQMVNVSRLSNAMRAAALMRRAVLEALVHARARTAFGRTLAELPQMRRDLLEMVLDAEAGASVILNGAAMLDRADGGSADDRTLIRIVTPLAKYWLTGRARAVTSEAMNVRGGNGYIEEWVNARLVRDSYLGAIWEGSTNVVALDVQRAVSKDGCHTPLAAWLGGRLDTVTDARAKCWVDVVRSTLDDLAAQAGSWPARGTDERELEARPFADALYHSMATALLLAEGQLLVERRADFRKLLVAALYARKWLCPPPPRTGAFSPVSLAWLDAIVDWTPVPADALGSAGPSR